MSKFQKLENLLNGMPEEESNNLLKHFEVIASLPNSYHHPVTNLIREAKDHHDNRDNPMRYSY